LISSKTNRRYILDDDVPEKPVKKKNQRSQKFKQLLSRFKGLTRTDIIDREEATPFS
jgi:hypothetical protein